MMMTWLLMWMMVPAQACDDVEPLLEAAHSAILEARLDDAQAALDKVLPTLSSCRSPATPDQLARMWNIEGVALAMTGANADADVSFAASARLSPDTWDANYGAALRERRDAAVEAETGSGTLALVPTPRNFTAHLDGTAILAPTSVTAGLHLIQVGPDEEPSRFLKLVSLPADQTTEVATGLTEPAEEPEPVAAVPEPAVPPEPVQPPPSSASSPSGGGGAGKAILIGVGAGLGALGAGAAVLASQQNGAMREASTVDELNSAYDRQKLFGYSAYGLIGAGTVGVGLGIVL